MVKIMNGDDTFSWAKKPALPDNRKRATVESRLPSRLCQKCALQGIASPIQLFQLNEEEALLMCKNAECTFMPSSNWESLIVKRSISKVPRPGSKKSSSSSHLSDRANNKKTTAPVSRSSCSLPVLASSSLIKVQTLTQKSTQNLPVPQTSIQRFLISPGCPQDLSLKGNERKTLVPIAPFLTGHAHSFSSFQTNKIEHKFQQRGTFVQRSTTSTPNSNPNGHKRIILSNKNSSSGYPQVGSKRRACSLDSDSLSSGGSSVDSRPTTPVTETIPTGKRIKRIVLPPDTLSKLLAGTWKLEIRKSNKTETGAFITTGKSTNNANSYPKDSERESQTYNRRVKECVVISGDSVQSKTDLSESDIPISKSGISFPDSGNLEITAIGALHDIVRSGDTGICLPSLTANSDSVTSHIEAINFQLKSDSIKLHIETINQHIKAINSAVGRSDLCAPIDFSNLCQKLGAQVVSEPTQLEVCQENQWMSSAGLRSDSDNSDTNSSQSTCSDSFIPVGFLHTQVSAQLPSNIHCEGFDEPLGCSTHTSQLFDDTSFKGTINRNLEGRF